MIGIGSVNNMIEDKVYNIKRLSNLPSTVWYTD